MTIRAFNGEHFKEFILGGFENLKANKEQVDALNVFPVPDGDTGTNMFLTVQSAAKKIEQLTEYSLPEVSEALSKGSLMGARGNSGVILSQIFRGFSNVLGQHNEANAVIVAKALQSGVETAYKAVMKPVEGTILTVTKEAAKEAVKKAKETDSVIEVLKAALMAGEKALALTPEQLPVLKQAGVVDAGGKGFLVILAGGIKALTGEIELLSDKDENLLITSMNNEDEVYNINYPYCTEFLVVGDNIPTDKLRVELAQFGDSLLVVGNENLTKIHIHTNRPGTVLDQAMVYGQLQQISISNMVEQNKNFNQNPKGETTEANALTNAAKPAKEIGLVAVASGQGLVDLLISMGVDEVVTGGQTMNPSTEDLLAAIDRVNANKIIILPNNSNIILAAKQVQELCQTKEIAVVPTKTFPQALAALLVFDPESQLSELMDNMTENIKNIKTGEITYAVRDSLYNELEIKEGEILGIIENEIHCTGSQVDHVVKDIIASMITTDSELITLFYGEEITEEEASQLVDALIEEYEDLEIEFHNGGQSLYYYIIAVE